MEFLAILRVVILVAAASLAAPSLAAESPRPDKQLIERGRYLAIVGGCNDCHTSGYNDAEGQVPESRWLRGSPLGFRGVWGTTYATNLRLTMANMTERQWLHHARHMEPRPPMPWFNVRAMSDAELKAIYAYTRSLGPGGAPAPAYLPPGQKAPGPVVQFPQ